ncbi:MAG: hypothetical protein ACTSVK_04605 [Promethearchaeota archaeon]
MPYALSDLIKKFSHERYVGIIIFGAADGGKTTYMQKFTRLHPDLKIYYLDVQEKVAAQSDTSFILQLTPRKFLDWIFQFLPSQPVDACIIDHFDFMFNLWDTVKKEDFLNRFTRIERVIFPKPFIAILQSDPILENVIEKNITNPRSIYRFEDLEEI